MFESNGIQIMTLKEETKDEGPYSLASKVFL
jgi:hypothetical protein